MRVILIGAGGQLGSDLAQVLASRPGVSLYPLTHAQLDITQLEQVHAVLAEKRPEAVINTAAYHRVDDCETYLSQAFAVNAVAVAQLAAITHELGAVLVHFSTDYVFDGRKGEPYVEGDAPAPLSVYGMAKLAGEQLLRQRHPRHVIVRTSGLYGVAGSSGKGGNFVETMLRLAREKGQARVVTDQVTAPTFTADLAQAVVALMASGQYGTFHLAGATPASWFDFAQGIFRLCGLQVALEPITSAELGSKARRPAYSAMRSVQAPAAVLQYLRGWEQALPDYLRCKGHIH
ncbi:MAG: dTDP-4-dehydrorhamnose reductase [Deinococcus sp.]|nr:dTDP-4-dehydrorhamnose reductase [Deinococcus sp.]